jgi:UDP-4-amino-4,6-dideoxy-N-acetyl-beta-L-altrosamine transaminase
MRIIPYGHQWIDEDDIKEVVKVLKSDWITQGPKVKEFEDALCKYTGAKYAVAVSSGTAALHIACLSAGIKEDDEVITSPITFVASANCVLYCGGRPVFADIQEDTVNIDPDEIKKKITKRTKAIIPVHFAGHPCDLEEIYSIAKEHNLIVIEDAAHALGAEYKGSKIGSCKYSDMTILSFHPVKSITTGEGGAVLTNNKEFYKKLSMFRNHGITKDKNKMSRFNGPWYYEMQELGFNYRITDFQCALGISQLKKLDKFIQRRRDIVEIYGEAFKNNEYFDLPQETKYAKSSWHLYPIRLKNKYKTKKNEIFYELRKKQLGVQVHYIPVYYHPFYQRLGYKKGLCPKAEEFYERKISIPLYQHMSNNDVKYVINVILKSLAHI